MLHELTPVIRNTSGSGEDLDLRASGSSIVSPEGAKNGGPMLELSIPLAPVLVLPLGAAWASYHLESVPCP